ncbi:MAG: hypothetical protein GDA52_04665 [Rhodobacteraceae bacterium]|nr:hypothetical protein [Paracoccaceae bacterium]
MPAVDTRTASHPQEQAKAKIQTKARHPEQADFATRADLTPLATKADLRAEIAGVKTEISEAKAELGKEIAGVRSDMKDEIAGVKTEIAGVKEGLGKEIAGVETRLGKEIAGVESRLGKEITDVRADLRWIIRIGGGIFAVLLVVAWFAARSAFL